MENWGQAVGRLAEAFGMQVCVAARPGQAHVNGRIPLAELLPQVDILTLHCPLTPTTKDLIGAAELQAMKQSALLINCARGGIVNEEALLNALINSHIAGAAMDVLTVEPPPANHPLLQYQENNLILTPIVLGQVEKLDKLLCNNLHKTLLPWLLSSHNSYCHKSQTRAICGLALKSVR